MIAFAIAIPLQVSAVILSAAKNPEGLNQPQPSGLSTHALLLSLPISSPLTSRAVNCFISP